VRRSGAGLPGEEVAGGDGEGWERERARGVAKQRTKPCVLIQVRAAWCFLIAALLSRGPWAAGGVGRAENDGRTKDARALASAGDGFACVAERSRGMVVKHHRRLGFFYHLAKQVCLGDFGRGGLEEEGKGLTGLLAKELELEEAESICRLATTDGCISICLAAPRRIRYKDLFGFVNFKSWMLVLSRKNVQITTKCRCT
jgi:hypothetical protein